MEGMEGRNGRDGGKSWQNKRKGSKNTCKEKMEVILAALTEGLGDERACSLQEVINSDPQA